LPVPFGLPHRFTHTFDYSCWIVGFVFVDLLVGFVPTHTLHTHVPHILDLHIHTCLCWTHLGWILAHTFGWIPHSWITHITYTPTLPFGWILVLPWVGWLVVFGWLVVIRLCPFTLHLYSSLWVGFPHGYPTHPLVYIYSWIGLRILVGYRIFTYRLPHLRLRLCPVGLRFARLPLVGYLTFYVYNAHALWVTFTHLRYIHALVYTQLHTHIHTHTFDLVWTLDLLGCTHVYTHTHTHTLPLLHLDLQVTHIWLHFGYIQFSDMVYFTPFTGSCTVGWVTYPTHTHPLHTCLPSLWLDCDLQFTLHTHTHTRLRTHVVRGWIAVTFTVYTFLHTHGCTHTYLVPFWIAFGLDFVVYIRYTPLVGLQLVAPVVPFGLPLPWFTVAGWTFICPCIWIVHVVPFTPRTPFSWIWITLIWLHTRFTLPLWIWLRLDVPRWVGLQLDTHMPSPLDYPTPFGLHTHTHMPLPLCTFPHVTLGPRFGCTQLVVAPDCTVAGYVRVYVCTFGGFWLYITRLVPHTLGYLGSPATFLYTHTHCCLGYSYTFTFGFYFGLHYIRLDLYPTRLRLPICPTPCPFALCPIRLVGLVGCRLVTGCGLDLDGCDLRFRLVVTFAPHFTRCPFGLDCLCSWVGLPYPWITQFWITHGHTVGCPTRTPFTHTHIHLDCSCTLRSTWDWLVTRCWFSYIPHHTTCPTPHTGWLQVTHIYPLDPLPLLPYLPHSGFSWLCPLYIAVYLHTHIWLVGWIVGYIWLVGFIDCPCLRLVWICPVGPGLRLICRYYTLPLCSWLVDCR